MAIFKINEGSYDFGEHKKTAKSIEARIASAIGAYPKGAYVPYQSSGYTLTRQDKDYRFTKQNFCLHPFGYNITKDDELTMKNSIKSAGGKYIVSSYGNIHFYIDETPFITARDTEQAEIDNDFNLRKSEYEDKLNAEDIEKYKPTDKILAKLQDYRSRGSKVNVKAIKDINKLLTYFYGACLMNWKDLYYSCIDVIPDEYRDIQNAISFRCEANSDLIDTRDTYTQNIAAQFSRVTSFLYDNNIGYKFIKRTPTSAELDFDRRNGCCWTLAYTLELDNGTKVDFANHTNEGGGTYGYSINGGPRIGKKEVEDLIIKNIERNLNIDVIEEDIYQTTDANGVTYTGFDSANNGEFSVKTRGDWTYVNYQLDATSQAIVGYIIDTKHFDQYSSHDKIQGKYLVSIPVNVLKDNSKFCYGPYAQYGLVKWTDTIEAGVELIKQHYTETYLNKNIDESKSLDESIYSYQTFQSTGKRGKPLYTLTYGPSTTVAIYNKNNYLLYLGADWKSHVDKLISWLREYFPGFFVKKEASDSASYVRFIPKNNEEAIEFIEAELKDGRNATILIDNDISKIKNEALEYNEYTGEWEEIDTETCIWCEEEFPVEELRKELNLGYLCSRCAAAIWSRGEKLTFEESTTKSDNIPVFGAKVKSLTESKVDDLDLHKGDWIEVNLNIRKNGKPNIIPVKFVQELYHGSTFLGWAWGERQNEYPMSAIIKKIDLDNTDEIIKKYTPDGFIHESTKPNKTQKYKSYYIVADPVGDGYNVFDLDMNLEDEGFGTFKDAQKFIDTLDESLDVVGYPTKSMSFDELIKLIKRNLDSDFISLAYNGQTGAGKCDLTFTRIDGAWARTNKKGKPLNRDTVNEINSLRLSNSEVFKELLYCLKNNDVFNLTLGSESEEKLTETLKEGRLNGSYDKTQLETDLLALDGIDKLDWDLSAYDELGEVIVLTHRAFEDSLDMSTYYMQRTELLRDIIKVFDKNGLKLVDPIEDQGTWWYFVLEHKNSVESSDKPQLEYVMVEFFETSGTPADDIMRRTKDVKYTDLSKLSELLVNADKIFREIDKYGGYNKVYFDNYIRYQGKLYKFHAGRVDIGDGPAEVSIPANYPEQVIDYFLSELNSGNKDIPIVEE